MKFIILVSAMFVAFSATVSGQKKMTVIVDDLEEPKGKLMVGIYNSESAFMKKTFRGFMADVEDATLELTLDMPAGEYALAVYHDLNENGKLDTAIFGIPTEKYGFSNNAKGLMGPPSYQKAKVKLTDNLVVKINL
ncbi:MAG: DUF2141 domain-containing protein [Tannerellaceae bacterium]|jgi:uncharacterized protein (DUF2141 family)|nr:DUF2141 domain-containing protein [Tannerellaceae bacterium]